VIAGTTMFLYITMVLIHIMQAEDSGVCCAFKQLNHNLIKQLLFSVALILYSSIYN
jgi:hypothetical protein